MGAGGGGFKIPVFDGIRESLDSYPEMAEPALTPDDAYTIAEKGKRAIYIGVENGHPGALIIQVRH